MIQSAGEEQVLDRSSDRPPRALQTVFFSSEFKPPFSIRFNTTSSIPRQCLRTDTVRRRPTQRQAQTITWSSSLTGRRRTPTHRPLSVPDAPTTLQLSRRLVSTSTIPASLEHCADYIVHLAPANVRSCTRCRTVRLLLLRFSHQPRSRRYPAPGILQRDQVREHTATCRQ